MSIEVHHASADTLLGQLQRGRGAGFLAACRETHSKTWPLLVECITNDPRLDRQVEDRDDYYASLVIKTGMELAPLAAHLRAHDDVDQSGGNTGLAVCALGSLGRRGYRDSVPILRDYVAWGQWWNWAIDELISTEVQETWIDLDDAFCGRFGSDELIKDELGWSSADEEPWKTWCKQNPRLRQLVGSLRKPAERFEKHDYSNLSVADLLRISTKDGRIRLKLRKIITHLVKPRDFEFLLSQVSIAEPERSQIALAGLTKLANPAMFDWLRDFWSSNPEMPPGGLGVRVVETMLAMPSSLTLPLARDWLDHPDWHFRHLAEELMEQHATLDDVPRLRHAIAADLADDESNMYRLCNLIEAFKHLAGIGRIPELESVFKEFRYSYGRARAAEALLATDKEFFISTYAQECLWDCEDSTRKLACESVNSASMEVKARLSQLSKDSFEDESVRDAAINRLQTSSK